MTVGIAAAQLNAWLDAYCRSVAYTDPVAFYVKLHTGDPGASGTANAFGDTTRKQAGFSAASAGAITTSADLAWTNLSASGTITHVSFWDHVSDTAIANYLGSDNLETSRAVSSGDNFTIATGDLDIAVTPVAA